MTEENETGANVEAAASQTEQHNQDSTMVPVDALQAERRERQRMQEELDAIRNHVSLMANQNSQPKEEDPMDSANDDDILTVGEAKKYIKSLDNNYRSSIEEMKFAQKNKDYQEVIQKYLPEVIKKNPRIKQSLAQTQDFAMAYELAKNSEAYRRDHFEKKPHEDAQRIMDNSQKSGSLSQVGSTAPANQARSYKTMSDQEFMREVQKNLGYV